MGSSKYNFVFAYSGQEVGSFPFQVSSTIERGANGGSSNIRSFGFANSRRYMGRFPFQVATTTDIRAHVKILIYSC